MQDDRILAIQREIQEKAFKCSDALSRRDWKLFERLWFFKSTTEVQGSRVIHKLDDSVLTEMKSILDKMDLFFQITHPGMIDVTEKNAKARFPFQQWSRFTDDQREVKTVGFFEDEWTRGHAGFWQIEKRTITVVHEEERTLKKKAHRVSSEAVPA